jgi:hypothetical protein
MTRTRISRRSLVKSGASAAAATLRTPALAAPKRLSFLAWNIARWPGMVR